MIEKDWAALFNEEFRLPVSRIDERISRAVLGDEYPEGLDSYSFLTRTDLGRFVEEVKVGPGDTLVDLGCGRGGPGLWVASRTGARLVGIDIAHTAVEAARRRA
jgi:2-polyprenyl-3-methyl-5-hydroxy-6-metoxy-1,4-benzoquinol methylase